MNSLITNLTLAESIPHVNKSPLSYLESRLIECIYLAPVSENEIGQLIKSLKYTAAGFDVLNVPKISSQFFVKPLTHICDFSLSQCIFPEQLKIANVSPSYIKVTILCCSITIDLFLNNAL